MQRTDNSGNVVRTYRYDAFGNILAPDGRHEQPAYLGADNNPFRYGGEHWDWERGEYYLKARSYSPRLGRFTSPDPFWNVGNMQFGSNPVTRNGRPMPGAHAIMQAGNLFMFTMHNPVRFIDPTGLFAQDVLDMVLGGIDGGPGSGFLTA